MTRRLAVILAAARPFVAAVMLAAAATPARAGLASDQLATVDVDPPSGAAFPLDVPLLGLDRRSTNLRDAIGGKAAVVVFVDYTCKTLCSPILAITAGALNQSGLTPDADFGLIVIGFNPDNSADDARRMIDAEIGAATPLRRATTALRADAAATQRLTTAVGYRFIYDAEHDLYAHPAALIITDGGGRVSRVLSGLALSPNNLRLALVEAGRGAIGKLSDRIHLLCYGFDAKIGFYTERIRLILSLACGLTLAAVLIGLAGLSGFLPFSRRST